MMPAGIRLCRGCGAQFVGLTAFDLHQYGNRERAPLCKDPARVKRLEWSEEHDAWRQSSGKKSA